MVIVFFVLARLLLTGIRGVNFGDRFLVSVLLFVIPFVVMLFFVLLALVVLVLVFFAVQPAAEFAFLAFGMAGSFEVVVFLFVLLIVFVEFGAPDLLDRLDFDAVLSLFVLGFDQSRGKRGNLIVAQVGVTANLCGRRFAAGCVSRRRLRSCGFAFGAGVREQPAGQAARKAAWARNGRAGGNRSAGLRRIVFLRDTDSFLPVIRYGGNGSGYGTSAILCERLARQENFVFAGRGTGGGAGWLGRAFESAAALIVVRAAVAALVASATAARAAVVAAAIVVTTRVIAAIVALAALR